MKLALMIAFVTTFMMVASEASEASKSSSSEEKEDTENYSWHDFKIKFQRHYTGAEESRRKAIFEETVAFIKAHNEKYYCGEESYLMGINQFADKLPGETFFGLLKPDKPKDIVDNQLQFYHTGLF